MSWLRLLALMIWGLLAGVSLACANERPLDGGRPLVVVLASEDDDHPWTRARLAGVRAALGDRVALAVELLGLERFDDPVRASLLKTLLRIKYAPNPPAAVVALDEGSAAFVADGRERLFPGAPALLSRLASREPPPPGRIWFGVVEEQPDIAGGLAAAAALQPDMMRLVVVNHGADSPAGRTALAEARRQVRAAAPPGVELAYAENLPLPALLEMLRGLSPRDAVLALSRDIDEIDPQALRRVRAPIYGVWDFQMNIGRAGDDAAPVAAGAAGGVLAGGCFMHGGDYGRVLGGQLRQVLAADDSPAGTTGGGVAPSPHCAFDYPRLMELGLAPERLPAGVALVNQPAGWLPAYHAFPALYWTAGLAAFGLAAAIAGLLLRLSAKDQVGRRAEALARQRSDQLLAFRETLDETRDCVFVIDDASLRFIYANRGAVEQGGYAIAELAAMTPLDIAPEIAPDRFRAMLDELRRGEREVLRLQTGQRRKDGRVFPVDVQLQHIPGRDGRPARLVAIVRDITEIRAVEAALRASEQRFELALAASSDGIWDWDLVSGRIWFSPRWKAQLGYADDELENSLEMWKRLIFPDDMADALQRVADYNEGRISSFDVVQRFRHKDGHTVYVHARAVHQRDADGRVVRMVGAHADITERQIAQLRLQESERRLRDLAAAAPGMMFQWIERRSGGHGFLWVSPRSRELFGVDDVGLVADWTRMRIHPDDLDLWRASLETAAVANVEWEFEGRILRGGDIRWVKGLARPVSSAEGVIFNGIFFDVSSERLMREETDRLRNRLDFLLNASPAVICATTADGRGVPTFLSPAVQQFGYRAADLLAERDWWPGRVHPDDRAAAMTALSDARTKDGEIAEFSYRFRNSAGEWRWISDRRVLVRDSEGRPLEVVGAMTDVSRVVAAEQAARQAQERLELVLQSAGEGIYGVDENGCVIFANAAVRRMTGFSDDELRGASSHDLFHRCREDGAAYPADECPVYRTIHDGRERAAADEVFWRKGGDCFPVEFVATPLCSHGDDGDGDGPRGAVVVFRDVTEARRVRLELQNSLRRWAAVLTNSPVGIALLDRERRFRGVNGCLAALFGGPEEAFIDQSARIVYPDDESFEALGGAAYPALAEGGVYRTETRLRRLDGELVWVSIIGSLIDVDDHDLGSVWVLEDITGRKAQELALHDKTRELERSNAELEAFAYVASHDLRQPLRVVNSYLALLQRSLGDNLDADSKEFIEFARGGAQRMDRLIVDLLEYSRVGRRSEPARLLKAGDLAAQALQNLAFAIEDVGGEVTVADDLPQVMGDESELMRLFQNLIGNAVKYHAPDRPPRVSVSVAMTEEGWRFAIADNGIGIPANQLERVFGIFQRLHGAEAYEGSGIGLAICRKIVERHGGRIWVESVEKAGSTFYFTLPPATD